MSLSLAVNLASSALYAAGAFFSAREALRRRTFAAPFFFLCAALGVLCLVSVSNVLERIAAFAWIDRYEEYAEVLILPFVLVFAYSWASAERLASSEAYLSELHHRVKNSLQVVESLLGVQAESAADGPARSALREARLRVAALGSAERMSLSAGGREAVRMDEYLSSIAESLGVDADIESGGIELGAPAAAACGLAATEVFLAARADAAAEGGARPRASLSRTGPGRCAISFEGWGTPLPAFSEEMLRAMAGKLAGKLSFPEGPSLVIDFPDPGEEAPWRPAASS